MTRRAAAAVARIETMKTVLFVAVTLAAISAPVTHAVELTCPELAQAVQVGACPTLDELRYTFTGFCANDERNYRGSTEVCTDFDRYRKLKNIALWESADGVFSGYATCDAMPDAIRQSRVSGIRSFKQGRITVLACSYGDLLTLSHRTRGECRITNAASCPADPAACRASCE